MLSLIRARWACNERLMSAECEQKYWWNAWRADTSPSSTRGCLGRHAESCNLCDCLWASFKFKSVASISSPFLCQELREPIKVFRTQDGVTWENQQHSVKQNNRRQYYTMQTIICLKSHSLNVREWKSTLLGVILGSPRFGVVIHTENSGIHSQKSDSNHTLEWIHYFERGFHSKTKWSIDYDS